MSRVIIITESESPENPAIKIYGKLFSHHLLEKHLSGAHKDIHQDKSE